MKKKSAISRVQRNEFAVSREFIQLDQLLKAVNLVSSGGEAHAAVEDGRVFVDGVLEMRKRAKLRVGQKVRYQNDEITLIAPVSSCAADSSSR